MITKICLTVITVVDLIWGTRGAVCLTLWILYGILYCARESA